MNATAMPAQRLTASFIWNTFLISSKKHLIITGSKGSGKTTLLNSIFQNETCGIRTWAEPKNAVFIKELFTGKTEKIGIFDPLASGEDKKMRIVKEGFHAVGIPSIDSALEGDSEWVTVDEIGYLESGCEEYLLKLKELFSKKRIAAVVRKDNGEILKRIVHENDAYVVDLDSIFGNIGCVIMASGEGKRFGGNKLTADFDGEPLIMHTLRATDGIFARRVVVTRHKDVYDLCEKCGVDVILHKLPYRSDTVRLGTERMSDTDGCIFCQGDQPCLRSETLAAMSVLAKNEPDTIIRAAYNGKGAAPILFPKWAYPELLSLPEGIGGGFVAKKYSDRVTLVNVRDEAELFDVDTREDLQKLAEYKRNMMNQKH